MARCTKEEETEIFRYLVTETYNVKINREQAIEVARILNEKVDMRQLDTLLHNEEHLVSLNSWINVFRFIRFKENVLVGLAYSIATETMKNAVTEDDKARGEREMKTANALAKGDIDVAFSSMNYFLDR
jgi:hypothetical protein